MRDKISFRPVTDQDIGFLREVYASTRAEEMARTGWSDAQIADFLDMQFRLQHQQYFENYRSGTFEIIQVDGVPAGRLYVDRRKLEIRLIDLALLPSFRRRGIGTRILKGLIAEAAEQKLPLTIHVEINNPAVNLYKRLGFRQIEDRGSHLLMEKAPDRQ